MATTFLQLQTEFYARGFDYLNDGGTGQTRALAWINQAYQELCEEDLWPFLLTSSSGAAPLTISDLRVIFTVVNTPTLTVLLPVPEDEVLDTYSTLTTTGVPQFFYTDDLVVRVYPVGGTITVRYWKTPTVLAANGDAIVVPDRFANLIVDGAVRRAANDSDDSATVKRAEDERQRGIDLMRRSLMFRDGLRDYQRVTFASADW